MNTTFNSALKQSNLIRRDLAALSPAQQSSAGDIPSTHPTTSPAALGTLSASIASFSRTLDEYNSLAKEELNLAKQEKAFERIRNFRSELNDFRRDVSALKDAREAEMQTQSRSELMGRRPYTTAATDNPYASASGASNGGGYGHQRNSSLNESGAAAQEMMSREDHAFREQNFFASTNTALDEYIARGQAVLGDLNTQREMLKNTQKKLYSVANTLGVSGDTIRMVERRAREDKWIFWAGVVIFVLFCWLVLHFLR